MKLCLINPPHRYLVHPNAQVPLGLLYVAAAAEAAGHKVEMLNLSDSDACVSGDADAYGITATSLDWALGGADICKMIRALNADAPIILGGAVSLAPGQVGRELVSTLVTGDGETAIVDLLGMIERGEQLPPAYTGESVDVKSVPYPARHLWPGALGGPIFANGATYFPGGSTVIASGRGCPFRCAFCANAAISGRRVRLREIADVIEEMEQVATDFGVRQFRFSDETFNLGHKRVAEFCKAVRGSVTLNGGIAWKASSRATPNDAEMYEDMASAGCKELSVGIESADPVVLDVLHKDATVEEGRTALTNMRRAGIEARVLMMIGTPGERAETMRYNLQFLLDDNCDATSLTVFVPFPGCDIRAHPEMYRCDIVNDDMATYNLYYYDSHGSREVKPYVRLWDFDYDEMTNNVTLMRAAAQALGNLNHG